MTALATSLDPWALATLDALAEQYATRYGDTPTVTAARRADLLAELAEHDTRPAANRAAWQRRRNHTDPNHTRRAEGAAA